METFRKPTRSVAISVSDEQKKARERERKALAIGYLEQIGSLRIKLYSKLSCGDRYPSQVEADCLAEITSFLSDMLESYSE